MAWELAWGEVRDRNSKVVNESPTIPTADYRPLRS